MLGPFNWCKHNCMYLCLRLSFFVTMAQKDNHEWMHTNFSVKSNHCRRHGCHKNHEKDYLLHLKSITYIRKINCFILTPHNCCDHCWIKTSVYRSFQNVTHLQKWYHPVAMISAHLGRDWPTTCNQLNGLMGSLMSN